MHKKCVTEVNLLRNKSLTFWGHLTKRLFLYALLDGENQNKMLVERLKNWLEQRAYSDIVSTINTLNDNSEQKVLGFIHLYDYILKSTDDDYELIDQLFFVPGRFEREFQK